LVGVAIELDIRGDLVAERIGGLLPHEQALLEKLAAARLRAGLRARRQERL